MRQKPGKLGGLGLTCPPTPLCLRVILWLIPHLQFPPPPPRRLSVGCRLVVSPPKAPRPSCCFAGLPGLNPGNTVLVCCAEKTNTISGFSGCQSPEFSTITIHPGTRFVPTLDLETTAAALKLVGRGGRELGLATRQRPSIEHLLCCTPTTHRCGSRQTHAPRTRTHTTSAQPYSRHLQTYYLHTLSYTPSYLILHAASSLAPPTLDFKFSLTLLG